MFSLLCSVWLNFYSRWCSPSAPIPPFARSAIVPRPDPVAVWPHLEACLRAQRHGIKQQFLHCMATDYILRNWWSNWSDSDQIKHIKRSASNDWITSSDIYGLATYERTKSRKQNSTQLSENEMYAKQQTLVLSLMWRFLSLHAYRLLVAVFL